MLFAGWRSVRMVKNCDLGLENAVCGLGQHFQALDHSFSPYGPPIRQITYLLSNCSKYRPNKPVCRTGRRAQANHRSPKRNVVNGVLWLNWNIRVCMKIRSLTFIWSNSFNVCIIYLIKTLVTFRPMHASENTWYLIDYKQSCAIVMAWNSYAQRLVCMSREGIKRNYTPDDLGHYYVTRELARKVLMPAKTVVLLYYSWRTHSTYLQFWKNLLLGRRLSGKNHVKLHAWCHWHTVIHTVENFQKYKITWRENGLGHWLFLKAHSCSSKLIVLLSE